MNPDYSQIPICLEIQIVDMFYSDPPTEDRYNLISKGITTYQIQYEHLWFSFCSC